MSLKNRYIFTVGIALFLLLANQIYVQYALGVATVDAHTINLAGRQRMLTQRLSFYMLGDNKDQEMAKTIYSQFLESHIILKGAKDTEIVNVTKSGVEILDTLSPYLNVVDQALEQGLLLSKEEEGEVYKALGTLLRGNNEVVTLIEEEHRLRVGQVRVLEIIIALLTIGVVVYEIFLVFLPTFNQLRHSRDSFVKASVELKDTLRLINVFAHDLKSPIQRIVTQVELMLFKEANDPIKRQLASISETAVGMNDIVQVMLRRGSSKREVPIEHFFLSDVLTEVKRDLSHTIVDHDAVVSTDCDIQLSGNKIEIRLLFQNLVSNAIKYGRDGVPPEISIQCSKKDTIVSIQVSDNGVGIATEDLERIFDYEYRAAKTEEREGHGYGLYHCMEIVRSHGGTLLVDSEVNKGSTFNITLPA